MGEEQSGVTSGGGAAPEIRFDRADFAPDHSGKTCTGCGSTIADAYFELNGSVSRAGCKDRIVATPGGKTARELFLRAALYGGLAAVGGAVLWYLVAKLFGIELGLIAIVVGIAVGMAVRKGSAGRGGRPFQVMAVIITYLSVATANLPFVIEGLVRPKQKAGSRMLCRGGALASTSCPVRATSIGRFASRLNG